MKKGKSTLEKPIIKNKAVFFFCMKDGEKQKVTQLDQKEAIASFKTAGYDFMTDDTGALLASK